MSTASAITPAGKLSVSLANPLTLPTVKTISTIPPDALSIDPGVFISALNSSFFNSFTSVEKINENDIMCRKAISVRSIVLFFFGLC